MKLQCERRGGKCPAAHSGVDDARPQVTEENMQEYLQLFVQHRLVGAIRPQIEAFRDGAAAME